jgi:ACS family hexuronate transporter-like MFS transporter
MTAPFVVEALPQPVSDPEPSWWTQKRWWIAILLCLVTTVGSVDRQAMSVTAAVLKHDYHLSNTQYGELAFAFLFAYGLGQLVAGVLLDRLGTKRALTLAVIWWSVAAIAHTLARGFWSFFAARAFLGITEGANLPGAMKAVAEWFPRAERSLASGIVTVGTALGLIVAPPATGLLAYYFGWRAAFIVPGLAGLAWVLVWQRKYFLPEEHPTVSPRERELALAGRIGSAKSDLTLGQRFALWGHYLHYRETWGLVLSRFVGDGAFYFFSVWLPLYLQSERGFSILKIAVVAALPFICADLGALSGGWVGQRLIRRGWSVNRSRKTLIWIGSLGVLVAWPVGQVASPWAALALAALAVASIQVKSASMFPIPGDMYPASDVATVWGMAGAAGGIGAALFQAMFGWMIDRYGYNPVFGVVSLMCVAQATLITVFIPRIAPLLARAPLPERAVFGIMRRPPGARR